MANDFHKRNNNGRGRPAAPSKSAPSKSAPSKSAPSKSAPALSADGIRLAHYMASAGVASRRKSEEMIADGLVTVNGEAVLTPAFKVPEGAEVCVNGKPIRPASEKVYLALNKPVGYTCTAEDVHARHIVFELLPKEFGRLFTVGRLDRDSEGLLLVTNDGDWAQRLSHPSFRMEKSYYVECEGNFTTEIRRRLLEGLHVEGEFLKPVAVRELRHMRGHAVLEFTMVEGRKREIRRLCEAVGLEVTLLRRVAFGPFRLGNLPPGRWRRLTPEELAT